MRLELSYRFVLGHVIVAVVALALPPALERFHVSIWGAIFVVLGVSAVLSWSLSRPLTQSCRQLSDCAERIRNADLSTEVLPQTGPRFTDETTDLAGSVHDMLESLRDLVEYVQHSAEQVTRSSRELSGTAADVDAANRAIAATMELVAEGAVRQREDVESAQASTREIAEVIRANSEAAREAYRFVSEADQRANAGVEVARHSLAKMQALFEKADQAGQLVFRFDQKIRSVHRITEMINSVSEKTHLLSLNASIEAARAGDAGRGFSVVAEEIRRLAESAAGSGKQIEDLIGQLEHESTRVSDAMREMGEGVRAGREDLDSIQDSLARIQDAVQQASRRAEAIFHEAERSVARSAEMVREFEGIAKVATENVGATDEMRNQLAVQTRGIEALVDHSARLIETSDRLDEVARRFRTRRSG
ncbi:MAG: methyl-accepting chemotaxis protein [Myxococcota bacterium]